MENTPKLLCRWCRPSDHEDSKCPKSGVNLITVGTDEEEILAITRRQAKVYPDLAEEKRKLGEAQAEIGKASSAETSKLKDITGTLARNFAEQNIVRQILQTEVPVKISDLLTMPQLRTAILNHTPFSKATEDRGRDSSCNDGNRPNASGTHNGKASGGRRDVDFGKGFDRHNCRRRVRRECVTGGYLEEVGKADVVATCIPVTHGRPAGDQTVGNLEDTASNNWHSAIPVGFRSHSIEKKRI